MTDIYTLTVPHDLDAQGLFRAMSEAIAERDRLRAEVARLREANRYLIGISNEAMEDARKYEEARLEIARLREALEWLLSTVDRQTWSMSRFHAAKDKARAALTQVAEVGK